MSLKIKIKKKKNKHSLHEIFVLEELFLDQLIFKLSSTFDLYKIKQKEKREIKSFIDQLESITRENLKILKKYYDH